MFTMIRIHYAVSFSVQNVKHSGKIKLFVAKMVCEITRYRLTPWWHQKSSETSTNLKKNTHRNCTFCLLRIGNSWTFFRNVVYIYTAMNKASPFCSFYVKIYPNCLHRVHIYQPIRILRPVHFPRWLLETHGVLKRRKKKFLMHIYKAVLQWHTSKQPCSKSTARYIGYLLWKRYKHS